MNRPLTTEEAKVLKLDETKPHTENELTETQIVTLHNYRVSQFVEALLEG